MNNFIFLLERAKVTELRGDILDLGHLLISNVMFGLVPSCLSFLLFHNLSQLPISSPLTSFSTSPFFISIYLFIYLWLCWVFVAARGLSLVAASGSYSSLRCVGFSLGWLLSLWSMGSRRTVFSSCGTRAQ